MSVTREIPWSTREGDTGTVEVTLPATVVEAIDMFGERETLLRIWRQLAVEYRAADKREKLTPKANGKADTRRASWMKQLDL